MLDTLKDISGNTFIPRKAGVQTDIALYLKCNIYFTLLFLPSLLPQVDRICQWIL